MCAKRAAKKEVAPLGSPERTCIACRSTAPRGDLVRVVLDPEGIVVIDLRGKLPGRGAWLHADLECLRAVDSDPQKIFRALVRGDRENPPRTRAPGDLEHQLREAVLRAVLEGLSLAAAGGALVSGHDALENAVMKGEIAEIVTASDASDRTVKDLTANHDKIDVTHLPIDRTTLGARIGVAPRAAIGLVRSTAFRHLRSQLRLLRSLG